jgi:uncharacterized protein (TIGR03382 family)
MKTQMIAAVAVAGFAGLATAGGSHTFDLSGLGVDGGYSTNFFTFAHDFGGAGTVTGISWDISYTPASPSWASELVISVDTDGGFADFSMADYGAPDTSTPFASAASEALSIASSDGMVFLTLWDSFQDGAVFPDLVFDSGSSVTITFVPAPGAMAVLGLGGLVAGRRRR